MEIKPIKTETVENDKKSIEFGIDFVKKYNKKMEIKPIKTEPIENESFENESNLLPKLDFEQIAIQNEGKFIIIHKDLYCTIIDSDNNEKILFQCEICDCSFQEPTNNSNIESVHEEKKRFVCQWCDYASNLKFNLKTHVESVHEGKRAFKCQLCNKRCSSKG